MTQSIIIPFYKNISELYFSLDLISKNTPSEVEIIVVANNINELNISFPNCKILKYNRALLYSKAVNIGVEAANGEIITLMDQDIYVTPGWYEALLSKLLSEKKIARVSPKMLNPSNNRVIEFGIEYTKYNSAHIGKDMLSNSPFVSSDISVSSACGGVLMTYKSLYQQLGGMDEDMPYICCDCDFDLKLLSTGKQVWIVADSIVYHKSISSKSGGKQTDYSILEHDSRWKFYQKNSDRIKYNLENWTSLTYSSFIKRISIEIPHQYIFLNLSSYQNIHWYKNQLEKQLNISFLDCYDFIVPLRNSDKIQIYDYVPFYFMHFHTPFVYFVDSFLSLRENALWYNTHQSDRDIIADINGALCLVQELLDNSY